jgi:tetratricopeptide (TPR) repeat protein
MPIKRALSALAAAALLASCATLDDTPPATTITPMPGLGTATFAVTAKDEQARAWFAQGLQLLWAFEHTEAVRVFRAALARDPSCAMCAWGVAYALGPNINNPDRGPVREIRRYIERAQQAAPGASPLERALIQAMAVRYGRAPEKDQKVFEAQGASLCGTAKAAKSTDPQDLGYAAAMGDVLQQFPNDPDVVTLYADAVMTTMPWEWWHPKTGQPNGDVATAREYARRYENRGDGAGEYAALLPLATLVCLGQWDAVLAETPLTGRLARNQGRPQDAVAGLREAAALDDEFGSDPPLIGGGARGVAQCARR